MTEPPAIQRPATNDQRWALAERICNSSSLRRSAKLRELLMYLCHRAWVEGAEEIREHEIGVKVFGRSDDYDSAQDTLVRVQASQLRKRLERYFAEEGLDEPFILSIPRGSYLPSLDERHRMDLVDPIPSAVSLAPDIPAMSVSHHLSMPEPRRRQWPLYALSFLCILLAATCGWLLTQKSGRPVQGVALQRFWSQFAPVGTQTTVVIADSTFSALQDMLRRPILLDEYVTRAYRSELDSPAHSEELKSVLGYLMERRYTSLADVMLVRRLWASQVLDPAATSVIYSRDLHTRNLQKGNFILVGSRRAVPWVDLFDKSLDFHFVYDESRRDVMVENRRPQEGEPKVFRLETPSVTGTYDRFASVVSLPNPYGDGNLLILSGQEMSGTEAAANLMTTEGFLEQLLAKLPQSGDGIPRFEALLSVQHVEYTTRSFEVLAIHVH